MNATISDAEIISQYQCNTYPIVSSLALPILWMHLYVNIAKVLF